MTNEISLAHLSVSTLDNNCYLLCAGTQGFLIDAADDAPALLDLAAQAGVAITAVLTTHQHWDHVRALEAVLAQTGARHYASYLDAPGIPVPVDVTLTDGQMIEFAGHEFPVRILRGHTPGGVALAVDIAGVPNLFVGDSLFPGGLGKTTCTEDFEQLFQDVSTRIFAVYPDEAIIWPGHGKPTTLGQERPALPEWLARGW